MPTFTMDICEGKDRDQLCKDYRRMLRAYGDMENTLFALLAVCGETHIENMSEPYRTKVKNLIEAYKD